MKKIKHFFKAIFINLILIILGSLIFVSCSPISTTPSIEEENKVVYRILITGVADYINYGSGVDFGEAPSDALIDEIISQWEFGPERTQFSTVNYLIDHEATKNNILQGIASTFSQADENDISYFYFAGHGGRSVNVSYLCPADMTSSLSSKIIVDELEESLSAIPGTKVILLDSCHSGGFIGKGVNDEFSNLTPKDFNDDVINIFSTSQNKGLLTTDQYKVLTSCHYYQSSYTVFFEGHTLGAFTTALFTGCGYQGEFPADADADEDGNITLQEAYLFTKNQLSSWAIANQDVQIYPENSTFTLVEY